MAVKVGSLDIQFGPDFDKDKANQLVQSLQQVIAAVRTLAGQTVTPTPPGVPLHELAGQSGLGPDHTVAGLEAGQVLVATAATEAHFAFLEFGQLQQTDGGTFLAPTNGSVIAFINGYWSASPNSFGLSNPGSDALIMWDVTQNAGAGGLAWSLPGLGIQLMAGNISVDATQLTHGLLLGLSADDHPQYALVIDTPGLNLANVFTALNTFAAGLTVLGDTSQTGAEPAAVITNTDDQPNEGSWRLHVEPGQWLQAGVNDDGSDCENWLYAQRLEDVVDVIGLSANSFYFNGSEAVFSCPIQAPAFLGVDGGASTVAGPIGPQGPPGATGPPGVSVSALSVTDGVTTVTGVTSIDFPGATVTGSTPNATVTVAGAGGVTTVASPGATITVTNPTGPTVDIDLPTTGVTPGPYTNLNATIDAEGRITAAANGGGTTPALPGTIPDLVCWFEFDNILASAGKIQNILFDRTPWFPNPRGINGSNPGVVVAAAQLNGNNVLQWPNATSAGNITLNPPLLMNGGGTYFYVINPANPTTNQALIGTTSPGTLHTLSLYLGLTTANVGIVDGLTAVMGTCSAAWTPGTWFQGNVTYDASTGIWAFRQVRAAANSGTYSSSPGLVGTTPATQFGDDINSVFLAAPVIAAFLAYNRVLSPTEITNVENYLFAKWGV